MKSLGNKSLSKILAIIINILWWIEWIGSGVLICAVLIACFFRKTITLSVPVTFSSAAFKTVHAVKKEIPDGILNVMNGNFNFPIQNNLQNTVILLAGTIAITAVCLLITYQLKLIFSSLSSNQPFHQFNVARIRNIGMVLIIFSFLLFLSNIFLNWYLMAHFTWEVGITLTYSFKINYLITGILLIILAEIFKQGVSLEEETNLTI